MWLNLLVDHLQFGYELQHHKIEEEKPKKKTTTNGPGHTQRR
jgi:hypothetical protein